MGCELDELDKLDELVQIELATETLSEITFDFEFKLVSRTNTNGSVNITLYSFRSLLNVLSKVSTLNLLELLFE